MADVIVYVHDSSDTNSFSYISNLRVSSLRYSTSSKHSFTEAYLAAIWARPYTYIIRCHEVRP